MSQTDASPQTGLATETVPDGAVRTADGLTASQALDRIEAATGGPRPGYRRLHARGAVFSGTFTPSGALASMTTAAHLVDGRSDVLVRFSNGDPRPDASDIEPGVRGMAVRFPADGEPSHDLVAATFRVFASRRPEGFVELVELLGVLDPRRSRMRRLLRLPGTIVGWARFMLRHPESRASLRDFAQRRVPASYATTRFDGLHAYVLVAPDGTRTAFRYRWLPDAGEVDLPKSPPAGLEPQFLIGELQTRLQSGPVRFSLVFQLAGPQDRTADPSVAWPEDRPTVVAGQLEVTAIHPDSTELDRQLVFDPTRVPGGLELSDDPVLRLRGPVYRLAGERRAG